MLLNELMKDVLSGIKQLRADKEFTVDPKDWKTIRAVSISGLEKRYGCTKDDLRKNVKLLKLSDIWNPDADKPEGKQFQFSPVHKFNKEVPVIFMLNVPGTGLLLVDTQGEDFIKSAVKLLK